MKYAVCEILGQQYLVEPGKTFLVGNLKEEKQFKSDKVIMIVDDGKVELGSPYLKKELNFEVVGRKKEKVRVATYKSKANHRRVIGAVKNGVLLKLSEETKPVKNKD